MRAPDIHRSFDVSNEHGLADVLAQRCSVADAIVASEIGGLDVMPAGRAVKSPHDLLGNGVWHRLLDDLRGKYRYIVLDTPPILSASEALLLARGADTALLCALRNVSRTSGFLSAYERLQTANISRVGVVLSGVPTSEYASKYGSYPYATAEA
jgi:tyrosine-protein kinase Etk/Wzc